LFWTFTNILNDPVATPFEGGAYPRQDSLVGV